MKKLLILDCDWVLYKPKELNVNAMVYAFNDVCDSLDCKEYKFTRIENCTYDKPVKWFYSYIFFVILKEMLFFMLMAFRLLKYIYHSFFIKSYKI